MTVKMKMQQINMHIRMVSLKTLRTLINDLGIKADYVTVESEKYPKQSARALVVNNEALLTEEAIKFLNTKCENINELNGLASASSTR